MSCTRKKNVRYTMSNTGMIRELFRSLEATLHERLTLIEQVIQTIEKPKVPLYDHEFVSRIERLETLLRNHFTGENTTNVRDSMLEERITALEEQLASTTAELEELKQSKQSEVQPQPSIYEDVVDNEEVDVDEEVIEEHEVLEEEEIVQEEEVVEEEVVEEEVVEEEEEAQELELEEIEYKGRTYYVDGDKNVYTTDDEGDVVSEPIGTWNGKKIVPLPK